MAVRSPPTVRISRPTTSSMPPAGYAVLSVNPRGSTSYGAEFANLIHHAYPATTMTI